MGTARSTFCRFLETNLHCKHTVCPVLNKVDKQLLQHIIVTIAAQRPPDGRRLTSDMRAVAIVQDEVIPYPAHVIWFRGFRFGTWVGSRNCFFALTNNFVRPSLMQISGLHVNMSLVVLHVAAYCKL